MQLSWKEPYVPPTPVVQLRSLEPLVSPSQQPLPGMVTEAPGEGTELLARP